MLSSEGVRTTLRWPTLRGSQPVSDRLCRAEHCLRHRHRIDCLLAIGLVLLAVAVTERSLLSGSKALTVASCGLVPVDKTQYTIGLSGFVPR